MNPLFPDFVWSPHLMAAVAAAFVCGGIVKGVTGIGFPILSIAFLANILPAPLMLGMMVLPMIASNATQAFSSGDLWGPAKRFWPMIAALFVMIWVGAQIVVTLDPRVFYGLVGAVVVLFTATTLLAPKLYLPPRWHAIGGPIAGAIGGFMGGISTMWGPPMVLYFVLIRLPKEDFVRAVGLIWLSGTLPLVLGYVHNGILTWQVALWSGLAIAPVLAGYWAGEWLRRRINEERFRSLVLLALFLTGLNLLRRAIF